MNLKSVLCKIKKENKQPNDDVHLFLEIQSDLLTNNDEDAH